MGKDAKQEQMEKSGRLGGKLCRLRKPFREKNGIKDAFLHQKQR
jgi:hypothetical protein